MLELLRKGALLATVALALLAISSNATLFSDQKGSNSVLIQNVGHVQHAHLSQHEPLVTVSSAQGALASLNLQDGSLRWRRLLEVSNLVASDALGLCFTADKDRLQAWQLGTGQLTWTVALEPEATQRALCTAGNRVYTVSGGQATAVRGAKGSTAWTQHVFERHHTHAHCFADGDHVFFAATTQGGRTLQHAQINDETGEVVKAGSVQMEHPLGAQLLVTEGAILALSDGGQHVCSAATTQPGAAPACIAIPSHSPASRLLGFRGGAVVHVGVAEGARAVLLTTDGQGKLALAADVEGVTAVSQPFTSDGTLLVAMTKPAAHGSVSVLIYDVTSGTKAGEASMASDAVSDSFGKAAAIAEIWALPQPDGHGFLMRAADDTLLFAQGGRVLWARPEALASVKDTLFLDLPAPGNPHAPAAPPHLSFADHLMLNLLVLKGQLNLASSEEAAQLVRLKGLASQRLVGTRDGLGLRKLLLVATDSGRLYGMHSGDGRVLWSSQLASAGLPFVTMRPSRVPHNTDEDSEVLIVFSNSARARAVVVNAYTGAIEHEGELPGPVTHVRAVHETSDYQTVFLMAGIAHPFPDALPTFAYPPGAPVPAAQPLYWWAAHAESGSVAGYAVGPAGGAQARKVWALSLQARLLAVQPREVPANPGHHVKVHGDRSMRFRYLDPNMAMIVSGPAAGRDSDHESVTVSIIDTVTGRVLHHQVHDNARGPVVTAFFENQAMLQFWDAASFRWHFSVMELYDHSTPTPTAWEIFSGTLLGSLDSARNVSSYTPVTLEVLRQSYFSKVGVRAMTPTVTAHGVTPRHVLMATITDQVYQMDAKLVDARRPKVQKPTAAHKEERLIPYSPQLPLMPHSYATYDMQVLRVRALRSAPAHLESTTHVFAWGLDLYYVLLRPAKGFDMLDEDFSFALLTVALLVLLAAVIAVSAAVRSARVKAQWL